MHTEVRFHDQFDFASLSSVLHDQDLQNLFSSLQYDGNGLDRYKLFVHSLLELPVDR